MKSLIEMAAERAVVEVPQRFINEYHKKPALLEFQVGKNLTGEQKEQIEKLSEDYRYNFIVTKEKKDIWDGFPKTRILEELRDYKNYKLEIWQGQSEESLKKFKDSIW